MGGDHQAFIAAPARAHAEDVHAVQHRRQSVLAVAVAQGEGEQAGRAFELLLPVIVTGTVGQGGVQHPSTSGRAFSQWATSMPLFS
jgi:hypothetical protein